MRLPLLALALLSFNALAENWPPGSSTTLAEMNKQQIEAAQNRKERSPIFIFAKNGAYEASLTSDEGKCLLQQKAILANDPTIDDLHLSIDLQTGGVSVMMSKLIAADPEKRNFPSVRKLLSDLFTGTAVHPQYLEGQCMTIALKDIRELVKSAEADDKTPGTGLSLLNQALNPTYLEKIARPRLVITKNMETQGSLSPEETDCIVSQIAELHKKVLSMAIHETTQLIVDLQTSGVTVSKEHFEISSLFRKRSETYPSENKRAIMIRPAIVNGTCSLIKAELIHSDLVPPPPAEPSKDLPLEVNPVCPANLKDC